MAGIREKYDCGKKPAKEEESGDETVKNTQCKSEQRPMLGIQRSSS